MRSKKLNNVDKEIIKIYQELAKKKKEETVNLSRQEVAKLFFRRPQKLPVERRKFLLNKEKEKEAMDFRHKLETEKQAIERQTKDRERFMGDWRKRVGQKSILGGIFGKKQEILNKSLRDLVKKGYLEKSGPIEKRTYRPTEKAINTRIKKF